MIPDQVFKDMEAEEKKPALAPRWSLCLLSSPLGFCRNMFLIPLLEENLCLLTFLFICFVFLDVACASKISHKCLSNVIVKKRPALPVKSFIARIW